MAFAASFCFAKGGGKEAHGDGRFVPKRPSPWASSVAETQFRPRKHKDGDQNGNLPNPYEEFMTL